MADKEETVIKKVKFLGATVESFSCDFGFNSNPSTATIGLVEDLDDGDDFNVDSFSDTDLDSQLKAAMGGNQYTNGNPGTFASFTLPTETKSPFSFNGIVTSWRRTNSSSGRRISVKMEDSRFLLSKIPIILNSDLITLSGMHGAINPAAHNIVDVFGHWGNIINADWTRDGISARKVLAAITKAGTYQYSFYGKSYAVQFSASAPSYFNMRIPPNYRVPISDTTVSQFLDKVAKDNNFDWYSDVATNGVITIHAIPRVNNGDLIFSDDEKSHPAHLFVASKKDRLISFEAGRELRKEANDVLVIGDKRRTVYAAPEDNGTRKIFPIFSESKDGHLYDKMFIPLDNIHSAADSGAVSELPFLQSEKKGVQYVKPELVVDPETGHEYIPYTKYQKKRSHTTTDQATLPRVGYLASEEILRAALFSKEAWATTVFYSYYDIGEAGYTFALYERSDDGQGSRPAPVGRTSSNSSATISVPIGIAQGMGVYYPDWDRTRSDQNPWKTRIINTGSSFWGESEAKQAIKEACYQATLKFAQEYYGKVFSLSLPYSPIYDGLLSNNIPENSFYQAGEKDILPEYTVVDGGPALFDLDTDIEGNLPYNVLNNENKAFTTSKGLLKPYMAIDHDALIGAGSWNTAYPYYAYASYEELDEKKTAKVQDGAGSFPHTEQLSSGFSVVTSDLSVEQYQFDPRFAIFRLNNPVLLGYGHIRGINITYQTPSTAATARGRLFSFTEGIEWATQPSRKDNSGAGQAFYSWLYRNHDIIPNLTVTDPDTGLVIKSNVLETDDAKQIDAAFYKKLLYHESKSESNELGFAQRRYIGLTQTQTLGQAVPVSPDINLSGFGSAGNAQYEINAMTLGVPLQWNYYRYGPFSEYSSLASTIISRILWWI